MPSAKGIEAATRATESTIVRLTAVFQIERRLAKTSGDVNNAERLAAPTLSTEPPDTPEIFLKTSSRMVLMVIVCPIEMAIALYYQYLHVPHLWREFTCQADRREQRLLTLSTISDNTEQAIPYHCLSAHRHRYM